MTRGGYRPNAKRPLKYGEATTPAKRRQVPKSKLTEFEKKVDNILKKWLVKKK
jgi:hypothetical protein